MNRLSAPNLEANKLTEVCRDIYGGVAARMNGLPPGSLGFAYLATEPRTAMATINAAPVRRAGEALLDLYGGQHQALQTLVKLWRISDGRLAEAQVRIGYSDSGITSTVRLISGIQGMWPAVQVEVGMEAATLSLGRMQRRQREAGGVFQCEASVCWDNNDLLAIEMGYPEAVATHRNPASFIGAAAACRTVLEMLTVGPDLDRIPLGY